MSSSVSSVKETSLSGSHSVIGAVGFFRLFFGNLVAGRQKKRTDKRALLQLLYEFNETALQECLSEDAVRRNQTTYLWMRL